jgi:hypothetical protein
MRIHGCPLVLPNYCMGGAPRHRSGHRPWRANLERSVAAKCTYVATPSETPPRRVGNAPPPRNETVTMHTVASWIPTNLSRYGKWTSESSNDSRHLEPIIACTAGDCKWKQLCRRPSTEHSGRRHPKRREGTSHLLKNHQVLSRRHQHLQDPSASLPGSG